MAEVKHYCGDASDPKPQAELHKEAKSQSQPTLEPTQLVEM